ncbi:hypothetical protein BJX99DRAFT_263666 [Aspergillus californicus]
MSPLFNCFVAMTRGAVPSRFIREPRASFTRLRISSSDILRKIATAFASTFTMISLSLTPAAVEPLLFGVDGYDGVPKRTTSAQVVIQAAALGARGVVDAIA